MNEVSYSGEGESERVKRSTETETELSAVPVLLPPDQKDGTCQSEEQYMCGLVNDRLILGLCT